MSSYEVNAWIQALLRWFHVFAGILWIGQTYLFNFLERNLERVHSPQADEIGHIWMVHGGGFYYLQKMPFGREQPPRLYWFKWQAALTWLSGMLLLIQVYYLGGLMLDGDGDPLPAIAMSVGVLLLGWFLYDVGSRFGLGRSEWFYAGLALLLVMLLHEGLAQVMSGRAAFFHVGALFGTLMAANVWLRILPAQRRILEQAQAARPLDPGLLALAPQRSRHNSYMVLPLVFIMISSHYPTISYGHSHSTSILAVIIVVGWLAARWLRG